MIQRLREEYHSNRKNRSPNCRMEEQNDQQQTESEAHPGDSPASCHIRVQSQVPQSSVAQSVDVFLTS